MRKMLFLFLISSLSVAAQRNKPDSIFIHSIPAGLGQPVHMPDPGYNADFNLDQVYTYHDRIRIFTIKEDSVYRKYFGRYCYTKDSLKKYLANGGEYWWYQIMERYLVDSIPFIDFSKNELVVYSACEKCLEVCHHKEGEESCHRAACDFREQWFIREKEPLYVKSEIKASH